MKKYVRSFLVVVMVIVMLCPHVFADTDGEASSKNRYIFSGSEAVNTGTDNGFSKSNSIEKGDPHYGWSLGDFCVTGFTSYVYDSDGTVVFLKNVGDKVRLGFELQQNKEALNGDKNVTLHYDTKAYDAYFQTKTYQHSMGLLVMGKKDYQNQPVNIPPFESFLEDVNKDEDKEVHICEEGDYEVALDYELRISRSSLGVDSLKKDSYEDYRIFFKFKVRNGNCMIFPRSLDGNELTNDSYSEDGFFLDFAKSRFLRITVRFYVLVEGKNGLVKDYRYVRPAAPYEKYTQSGIYEIDVENQYTKQIVTKVIYVGTDPSIRMMGIDAKSLEEVNEELYPTAETTKTSVVETTEETTAVSSEPTESSSVPADTKKESNESDKNDTHGKIIAICVVGSIVALIVVILVIEKLSKNKKNKRNKKVDDPDSGETKLEKESEAKDEKQEQDSEKNSDTDDLPYGQTIVYEKTKDNDQPSSEKEE